MRTTCQLPSTRVRNPALAVRRRWNPPDVQIVGFTWRPGNISTGAKMAQTVSNVNSSETSRRSMPLRQEPKYRDRHMALRVEIYSALLRQDLLREGRSAHRGAELRRCVAPACRTRTTTMRCWAFHAEMDGLRRSVPAQRPRRIGPAHP